MEVVDQSWTDSNIEDSSVEDSCSLHECWWLCNRIQYREANKNGAVLQQQSK